MCNAKGIHEQRNFFFCYLFRGTQASGSYVGYFITQTHLKTQACTILAFPPPHSGQGLYPFFSLFLSINKLRLFASLSCQPRQQQQQNHRKGSISDFILGSNLNSGLEPLCALLPFLSKEIRRISRFERSGKHFHFTLVFFLRTLGNKDHSLVS